MQLKFDISKLILSDKGGFVMCSDVHKRHDPNPMCPQVVVEQIEAEVDDDEEQERLKPQIGADGTPRYMLHDYQQKLLLDDGYVPLLGDIDDDVAKDFLRDFNYVSKFRDKIVIIINSRGGEVFPGLLIFNTIKHAQRNGKVIIGEVRGLAASMAADILQACTRRIAYKMSRILIHVCGKAGLEGDLFKLEDEIAELKKLNVMLRDELALRTKKSPEEIEQKWERKDLWFSAEQAKEFGLLDEII